MADERDEVRGITFRDAIRIIPDEEIPSQLRQLKDGELEEVLAKHRKWVESNGEEGTHANLAYVNLKGANLRGAFLRRADLQGANLEEATLSHINLQSAFLLKANLKGADLQKAILFRANVQKADLQGADLKGANLSSADLTDADLREANLKGATLGEDVKVSGVKLGGANLDGVTLPKDLHKFEGLETVEELSKSAKRIFQIMLLGCAYAWLTIATTTDARLLTNSPSSPLPIIQTQVPIVWFYFAAPILLLGIYVYFHIYLQRLWEGLADLPAIFPDGTPLDKRAYPWILNGLVRSNFALLRSDPPPLSGLQSRVSIFLAWWSVPVTLFLFWGRYLPRHDLKGTFLHVTFLAMSIGFGILSYRLARDTIRMNDVGTFDHYPRALTHGLLVAVIFFIILSPGAIDGIRPGSQVTEQETNIIREWIPRVLNFIAIRTFADLAEVDVSTKPPNWTGQKEEEIALVKGARLGGRNLRYAKATRAFLVNADLRWADLRWADLSKAKLQGADLTEANLQNANLSMANLHGAKLQDADLTGADLHGAELFQTDLQETNFQQVNLRGANLKWVGLQRAKNLTTEQVKEAQHWDKAFYDQGFLEKLGLPPDHNEKLKEELTELKKKQEEATAGKK